MSDSTCTIEVRNVFADMRVNPRTGWLAIGIGIRFAARTRSDPRISAVDSRGSRPLILRDTAALILTFPAFANGRAGRRFRATGDVSHC